MILRWLADDFAELGARHPEARVVLWFDEKEEFARLLGPVREALEREQIVLLAYDPTGHQGQLWIKWCIEAGPQAEAGRVVVWLPFARDRLHRAPRGEVCLEALAEYEHAGKVWLIDGRRPTLFGFLRRHGVPLPESRGDQDALWRGGRDSLLAKYVFRFADRDETFWRRSVTPAAAEAALIGNLEEQLLLALADPPGAAADLTERGLLGEFDGQVRSELGWETSLAPAPETWARELATCAALCEAFEACGRPGDFPYLARLPDADRREHWLAFFRRWMGSRDHEPSFRRWMAEVEQVHDLRGWPGRRRGRPHALRGLAEERWRDFCEALGDAAGSRADLRELLERESGTIGEEAAGYWAIAGDVQGWRLVSELHELVEGCRRALERLPALTSAAALVEAYADEWYAIDLGYWQLLAGVREADEAERLLAAAGLAYSQYLEETARRFHELVHAGGEWPPAGSRGVRSLAATLFAGAKARSAVIIVDALRFDLARRLADGVEGAKVESFAGHLPSVTAVGMAGLLPLDDVEASLGDGGRLRLHSAEAGGDLAQRQVRWRYLQQRFGAATLGDGERPADLAAVLDAEEPPDPLPELLVVMDQEIDGTSHATRGEAPHHFDLLLGKLRRAVAKLQQAWGYGEVHVVTDHGFVLAGPRVDPPTGGIDKRGVEALEARYAFPKEGAVMEGTLLPFPLDPRRRVLLAPGLRSFRAPGRFFHGGLTLQEVVIPHVVFRRDPERQRMGVRPLLPATEVHTLSVKVELEPVDPRQAEPGQSSLFECEPEPIRVRVFLGPPDQPRSTEKEVTVTAGSTERLKAVLHLDSAPQQEEKLEVHVVDADTGYAYDGGTMKVAVKPRFPGGRSGR